MQSDSPRRSRSAGGWDRHRGEEIRGKAREREGEGRKLGSSSSSPRRLHASAVPRRLPLAPGAVAMAAVAVLRNDSLQAFLQVSTRARGCSQGAASRGAAEPPPALRGGSRRLPPPSRGFTPAVARERWVVCPRGGEGPGSGSSGRQLPSPGGNSGQLSGAGVGGHRTDRRTRGGGCPLPAAATSPAPPAQERRRGRSPDGAGGGGGRARRARLARADFGKFVGPGGSGGAAGRRRQRARGRAGGQREAQKVSRGSAAAGGE